MVDLVNAIRDGQSFVGLPDTIVADEEVMVLSPTAGPTIFTILLMILVKVKEKNLSTLFTVVNSPLGEPPNTVNNKLLLNIITYEEVMIMVLMIVAQNGFRDEEYFKPKASLESAGYQVVTGSVKTGTALGKLGGTAKVDVAISEVKADDYAGVVFVGGPGAADYFTDKTALNLAREAYRKGKVVGAICIAPGILARAGILKGKKATVFPSETETLKQEGANYLGLPVVVDGKIVTANGPDAAEEFGKELIKSLGGPTKK